jgi:hypothetical protein
MSTKKTAADGKKATTIVANDPDDLKGTLKNIGGSMSDHWNNLLANQKVARVDERGDGMTEIASALPEHAPHLPTEEHMVEELAHRGRAVQPRRLARLIHLPGRRLRAARDDPLRRRHLRLSAPQSARLREFTRGRWRPRNKAR